MLFLLMVALWLELAFNLAFAIIAIMVAIKAYRSYQFFNEGRHLLLSQGFALIALSFLSLAYANALLFTYRRGIFGTPLGVNSGFYLHEFFFLTGLVLLLFLYVRADGKPLRLFIMALVLFAYALTGDMMLHLTPGYYILLSLLLFTIIIHLYLGWREKPLKAKLLVILGLLGIFWGQVLLAALFLIPGIYIIAQFVTLAGFLSILAAQVKQ